MPGKKPKDGVETEVADQKLKDDREQKEIHRINYIPQQTFEPMTPPSTHIRDAPVLVAGKSCRAPICSIPAELWWDFPFTVGVLW